MELNEEYIEKLRKKDEDAVRIFVREYKIPLYNYIYRIVYNKEDAEDLLQDTFLKIFKNINNIDFKRNARAFIFKIARNCCIDFLRKKKKEMPFIEEIYENKNDIYERMRLKGKIESALLNLKEEDREIIILKYIENFKIKEISEIMGIQENTVKIKIFRALKKLKSYFSCAGGGI
ncbi:MAG: RNA polymerase sigma factor [candidate division WOR-3 bacterium]